MHKHVMIVPRDNLQLLLIEMQWIMILRDEESIPLELEIDFQSVRFVSPLSLGIIAAFVEKLRLWHDVTVECVNCHEISDYVSRMNFFREVGVEYDEWFERRDSAGRFIPITRITDENRAELPSRLSRIMQDNWDGIDDTIIAVLDWSIAEIIDNVANHSMSNMDAFVVAQHFPNKRRLDFIVIDGGIGIPNRLTSREIYSHLSKVDALEMAVEKDVTVDPETNRGAGLYYTKRIIEENGGILRINSDEAELMINGGEKTVSFAPEWQGTIVQLRISTEVVVDPENVWGNIPPSVEAIMENDRELW